MNDSMSEGARQPPARRHQICCDVDLGVQSPYRWHARATRNVNRERRRAAVIGRKNLLPKQPVTRPGLNDVLYRAGQPRRVAAVSSAYWPLRPSSRLRRAYRRPILPNESDLCLCLVVLDVVVAQHQIREALLAACSNQNFSDVIVAQRRSSTSARAAGACASTKPAAPRRPQYCGSR